MQVRWQNFFLETLSACFLDKLFEYRINKIFKSSISIMCTSKGCKARATLLFDGGYIIIDDNNQFDDDMNSEEKLNTCSNYR